MHMRTALFLFDRTGAMAAPFIKAGWRVVLIDGQHPLGLNEVEPSLFKLGLWVDNYAGRKSFTTITELLDNVQFIFGFPECRDLAVSGAPHFARKRLADPEFQYKAASNALLIPELGRYYSCPWAFENPVSVLSTLVGKPDFTFHPYEFGGYLPEDDAHPEYPEYIKPRDAYPKKTCIWAGNGFVQPLKRPVPVDPGYSLQHTKLGGKSLKTKNIRSATPRGYAVAVAKANIGGLA